MSRLSGSFKWEYLCDLAVASFLVLSERSSNNPPNTFSLSATSAGRISTLTARMEGR